MIKDKLINFYSNVKDLKEQGMKMKTIAEVLGISPSVLSSLYTTILPSFEDYITQGDDINEALEKALANVNNLSKKKLLNSIDGMLDNLENIDSQSINQTVNIHPFFRLLKKEVESSAHKVEGFEGIYTAYSCSSSTKALKVEHYYITVSESTKGLVVGRKSVRNSVREGVAIIKEQQTLYIMFNAFSDPNISLVSIFLQIPFLEEVNFLKGLYLVLDYNKNPVARRIVFVKRSDKYTKEEFDKYESKLAMYDELSDDERLIYDYTCESSDSIKMITLPSPKLDLRDLKAEKSLLKKEDEIM